MSYIAAGGDGRRDREQVGRESKSAVGDRSLITGRRGATKWENRGSESLFAPPPPLKTGQHFLHTPSPF